MQFLGELSGYIAVILLLTVLYIGSTLTLWIAMVFIIIAFFMIFLFSIFWTAHIENPLDAEN